MKDQQTSIRLSTASMKLGSPPADILILAHDLGIQITVGDVQQIPLSPFGVLEAARYMELGPTTDVMLLDKVSEFTDEEIQKHFNHRPFIKPPSSNECFLSQEALDEMLVFLGKVPPRQDSRGQHHSEKREPYLKAALQIISSAIETHGLESEIFRSISQTKVAISAEKLADKILDDEDSPHLAGIKQRLQRNTLLKLLRDTFRPKTHNSSDE